MDLFTILRFECTVVGKILIIIGQSLHLSPKREIVSTENMGFACIISVLELGRFPPLCLLIFEAHVKVSLN